jgi:two-component SAPR family response regulator
VRRTSQQPLVAISARTTTRCVVPPLLIRQEDVSILDLPLAASAEVLFPRTETAQMADPATKAGFPIHKGNSMSMLRVFLFGKFHVQCGEQTLAGFDARKVQELFCYLLLNRERSHSRETLADFLWSDAGTQAKNYLRKTLWQLQSALSTLATPTPLNHGNVLLIESEWIEFNHAADLWLDVLLFEQAFALVQDVPGKQLVASSAQVLKTAGDLYRGDASDSSTFTWPCSTS